MSAARGQFLDAAAKHLHHDAPAVAAALGSTYLSHVYSLSQARPGLVPKAINDVYCGACGSLFVPDEALISELQHQSIHEPRSRTHLTCTRCYRKTKRRLQSGANTGASSQLSVRRVDRDAASEPVDASRDTRVSSQAPALTNPSPSPIQSSSTPGKKRPRTKAPSGLAALLAKSKSDAAARRNDGLDLADFMKLA